MRGLPHEVRVVDRRTVDEELDDLIDDLETRLAGAESGADTAPGTAPPERFFLMYTSVPIFRASYGPLYLTAIFCRSSACVVSALAYDPS